MRRLKEDPGSTVAIIENLGSASSLVQIDWSSFLLSLRCASRVIRPRGTWSAPYIHGGGRCQLFHAGHRNRATASAGSGRRATSNGAYLPANLPAPSNSRHRPTTEGAIWSHPTHRPVARAGSAHDSFDGCRGESMSSLRGEHIYRGACHSFVRGKSGGNPRPRGHTAFAQGGGVAKRRFTPHSSFFTPSTSWIAIFASHRC